MNREEFVEQFGGVFEHSPWIAERAWDHDRIDEPLTSVGVHEAMCEEFRTASRKARMEVLRAHPDLAGRLALANQLTASSKAAFGAKSTATSSPSAAVKPLTQP